jgi:hypothetical protein
MDFTLVMHLYIINIPNLFHVFKWWMHAYAAYDNHIYHFLIILIH